MDGILSRMKPLPLLLTALVAAALALAGPAHARRKASEAAPTRAAKAPAAAKTPSKTPSKARPRTSRKAVAAAGATAVVAAGAATTAAATAGTRGPAASDAVKAWPASARAPLRRTPARDGEAEARLIEVYRLIGQGKSREALSRAGDLVQDHPNFQLAQLVYGDLLSGQRRPLRVLGDVPEATARAAAPVLAELREESQARLKALRERPPAGTVPSQFLTLSPRTRHAIAVDASRSRLYLFENAPGGLRLVSDYYVSVGKLGIEKTVEGDQRTPLGVYYITSNLDRRTLKDFYGSGALPINYPNPLDLARGKTGSGIWLHGTPPEQFSRAPKASDGCVVLANPDLERLLRTVEVRTTPVVIAQHLQWVAAHQVASDSRHFESTLAAWQQAKAGGDLNRLLGFYAPHFKSFDKTLEQWVPTLRSEVGQLRGRQFQLKDLSFLRWTDSADTMVVTFGEVIQGMRTGPVKRQYWIRQGQGWKIFFEGVIG